MNRNHLKLILVSALLVAALIAATGVSAAPHSGLVVSLGTSQAGFSAGEDVLVDVTIANQGGHTERLLRWFTPAAGLEEPVFTVTVDGVPVDYTGAVYKRPPATGSDYISLRAGESLNYTVNLGDYYDLTASGEYEIIYNADSAVLFSERGSGGVGTDSLTSAALKVSVEGRHSKKPSPTPTPPPGGTTFVGCTTAQQSSLTQARGNATTYAANAVSYLNGMPTDSPRFAYWFGIFDTSHFGTVSSHFGALKDKWTNAGVNFDCSCRQNYYAYVYPNRPYNIYLCRVFWTAPNLGTDSKAGTLIHEMSHFYTVASTQDYVYGQTGAHNLALSDPDKAINNADNHEYFAENMLP